MSQFPQFSKPYPKLLQKIKGRAGSRALWNTKDKNENSVGVNGLTPWIRVISAVKSQVEGGKENGLILQSNYPEDGFNIRYGGTKDAKSGVVGFTLDLKPVRIGSGRKLRPSPIITNLNIDEADIGRKKTTFDIICYSLEHMEEVAKYFLNPGFSVLVEWGWNTREARKSWCGYTDSTKRGEVKVEDIYKYNQFKTIKEKREKANYDYDATLGFITDGSLEFGDNETFKISVTLSSIGEVAEYMQSHVNAKKEGDASTPTFDDNVTDEKVPEGENQLELNFNYMRRDLPYGKKKVIYGGRGGSKTIKPKPIEKLGSIKPKEPDNGFHDISNYVNFNEGFVSAFNDMRETIGSILLKDEDIQEGTTFVDDERFIRFELAVDILNSNVYDLDGKSDGQSSLVINIQDSFIGGFPNMFSADASKLFIPNTNHPDFAIDKLLYNTEGEEVKNIIEFREENKTWKSFSGNTITLNAGEVKNTKNMCPKPDGSLTYTGTRKLNGENTPHAFPSTYDLNTKNIDDYKDFYNLDDTMETVKCDKGYWGWLKNLYINFDFFLDTLVKPNLFTKDILYELLNGMSNACGNQWKFQIVENPTMNGDGPTELRVIDEYFTGLADLSITDNIFQLRGTASPFISADFKTDVPKAQQNSIIQKRLANDITFKTGDDGGYNNDLLRNVFGVGLDDEVLRKISPIEKSVEEVTTEADDETKEDINKRNKEFFLKKGTLVVKNNVELQFNKKNIMEGLTKGLLIAAWNDQDLLKQVRTNAYAKKKVDGQENLNIPYGLAEVSFQVHGISGFKRGDYLQFVGLPKNFTNDAIYQVHEISHEISSGGWFTNIVTKMRPYKHPTK